MNGPDHYREAERLLTEAEDAPTGASVELYFLGAAQVHATLALAAATAVCSPVMFREGPPDQDLIAWQEVAGGAPEPEPSDEPGQVEPEPAGVRVIQVESGTLVTYPEWNGGEPVKVLAVEGAGLEGRLVRVRYTFFGARDGEEAAVVSGDTLVTPYGGGE